MNALSGRMAGLAAESNCYISNFAGSPPNIIGLQPGQRSLPYDGLSSRRCPVNRAESDSAKRAAINPTLCSLASDDLAAQTVHKSMTQYRMCYY